MYRIIIAGSRDFSDYELLKIETNKFIDEYEEFFKQLRLVIYEADQRDICDYKKIEKILTKHNFKNVEISGQNYVWKK